MEESSRKRRSCIIASVAASALVSADALLDSSAARSSSSQHDNAHRQSRRTRPGSLRDASKRRRLPSCDAWHVSVDPAEFDTCTNSEDYPPEWNRPDLKALMLYSNRKKCCKALEEMLNVKCRVVDVCQESQLGTGTVQVEDLVSTTSTTTTTTSTTTTSTTATTAATTTKTAAPQIFYPVPQSGLCLSNDQHDIVSPFFQFSTPEECCSSGWLDYESCLSLTIHALYAAVPSTASPSMAPNTDWPTWNPTQYDCTAVHSLWHMSTTKLFTCTNDNLYPKEWMLESDIYLFPSADECCLGRFPGLACNIVDLCVPTPSPTKMPTNRPTKLPTQAPTHAPTATMSPTESPVYYTSGECNDNKWHMSRRSTEANTCTNDKDYPDTWNHETLSMYFLMASPEECCEKNYFGRPGKECIIYDVCYEDTDPPTNKPTAHPTSLPTRNPAWTHPPTNRPTTRATTKAPSGKPVTTKPAMGCGMWHPMTEEGPKSCTNGLDDYPSLWNSFDTEAKSGVFFNTAEDCCLTYWSLPCQHVDLCDYSPTGNVSGGSADCGQWHPVVGSTGPKSCSNGKDDYPASWDSLSVAQKGKIFFDSPDDCCQSYWKQSCGQTNQCEGSASDPINDNVNDPVDSSGSTGDCALWHPTQSTSDVVPLVSCSNGKDDYPKSWDTLTSTQKASLFFEDPEECCQSYWGKACRSIDDKCAGTGNDSGSIPVVSSGNPTKKPTSSSILQNDEQHDTMTSLGTDDFEDSSVALPWIVGSPPQWNINVKESVSGTHSIVNMPATWNGLKKGQSTLALKTNLSQSARFKCNVKVDTKMPFDWFSLRVDGKVKYPYYSTSNGKWTQVGSVLSAGEHFVELVVENGPTPPTFDRSTGLSYGTGYVWLDDCGLE
eukprot:CCRYP_001834-RB/>CCRYP_001834-RB protein AED:0.06 eAED:0.06 QI:339/1/1/1/1/1/5/159/885